MSSASRTLRTGTRRWASLRLSIRMSATIGVDQTRAAAERARPHVLRSPMMPVEDALLKLECLQPTGSFKVRGFFAAALALEPEKLRRGLITVSAGNAAQACAYVARTLGVPCRVVMYETAPAPKIEGVKRWGATPILMPREAMLQWMADEGWRSEPETFLHPFADPRVMAGHGGSSPARPAKRPRPPPGPGPP